MKLIRIWIGLVLLSVGVLGILDTTGVLDGGQILSRWWPVAVIGVGLAAMVGQRHISLGPLIVIAVGLVLLAGQQHWTMQGLIVPAILIIIGLLVLSGLTRIGKPDEGRNTLAVFSGSKVQDHSQHLTHTSVSAIFGGATLDLRDAHIDREANVDALALFGGVEVLVPPGWRISLGGLPIFGGYEDKTHGNGSLPPDAPLLKVNATAIFGGVSVTDKPK